MILLVVACSFSCCQAGSQNPKPSDPPASAAPSTDAKKAEPASEAAAPPVSSSDPARAQLIADTEKLLKLSQELKAEVAKSNKDTLSLTVVKKAEEVEKLARSLKERLNKNR